MRHYDEHTLELYVLGAESAGPERADIDAHLKECHGCRSLVDELRAFHAELADIIESETAPVSIEQALARRPADLASHAGSAGAPLRYQPRTPAQRLRYFLARHPVAAAAAAVTFAAFFIGLGMLVPNAFRKDAGTGPAAITDWNPAFHQYDPEQRLLIVYNSKQEVLWTARLRAEAQEIRVQSAFQRSKTEVADIDGDGVKEVVTTEDFSEDPFLPHRHLRVFDGHKHATRDVTFEIDPSYRGRTYSPFINIDYIHLGGAAEAGKREIFLSGNSFQRSPAVILRLDAGCRILGEYWHFGNFGPVEFFDIDHDGREEILALAQNDEHDGPRLGQYPVMVVLDPARIDGKTRSSACPGFTVKASGAELYYLRFPASSLDSLYRTAATTREFERMDSTMFSVALVSGKTEAERAMLHYWFSFDMRVREVKSNDTADRLYADLARQGKLLARMDEAYLDGLRRGVRYWDGTAWQAEPARVRAGAGVP